MIYETSLITFHQHIDGASKRGGGFSLLSPSLRVEQINLDGTRAKIYEGNGYQCRDFLIDKQADPLYKGCEFSVVSNL